MNDVEEAVRRLFTAAAEDIPPGIDLLGGLRTRRRTSMVRARVLLSAATAGIVAAVVAITLSTVRTPSALAQVTQAATRTAAQSYRVSSVTTLVKWVGSEPRTPVTMNGEFDPAQGVGEETSSQGIQTRYVGSYMYVLNPPLLNVYRNSYQIPEGKSWLRLPALLGLDRDAVTFELTQLGSNTIGLEQADPRSLLALLESASQVREAGPASGPGWTGSAYTFTAILTLHGPVHIVVSSSGTIAVDQQGRVRRLDTTETIGNTERRVEMTFGDFGVPVSVSPPPASETFTP
jgi:hypothetical protein